MVTCKQKVVIYLHVPVPSFFTRSRGTFPHMAFFGLTHLGYQNPIGDKMIVNPRGASHLQDDGINTSLQEQQGSLRGIDDCHQSLPQSTDEHCGSHQSYKEMVKRVQIAKSPKQLYKMPLTENQQYGWMLSQTPEPWTQTKRFPRRNSEMTKFVNEISMTHREFCLF